MLCFTAFSAALILNLTMQAIVIYQLYVQILFGSLAIAFILALYPIRKSLRKLCEKKETKKEATIFFVLIYLIFYAEVVYFLPDPPIIFSILDSRVITDKNAFDYAINTKTLIQFIALPILSAFIFTLIKNKLVKEGYEIHDRFRNNYKFAAYIVLVSTAMYFLFIVITS